MMGRLLAAALGLTMGITQLAGTGVAGTDVRYSCSFENGKSWSVADNAFKADQTTPLTFEISKISRKAQTAELTTATGRTDLKLVAAIDAMHFIEVTVAGYLTLTTLYGDGARVPAVHSRHLGIVGQPVGGQLSGFCERK